MTTKPRTPDYRRDGRETYHPRRLLVVPPRRQQRMGEAVLVQTADSRADSELDATLFLVNEYGRRQYTPSRPIESRARSVLVSEMVPALREAQAQETPALGRQGIAHDIHRQLGKTAKRTDILERSLQSSILTKSTSTGRFSLGRAFFVGFVAIIVALTGYVSLDTWLTNRKVESQYVHASDGNASQNEKTATSGAEGQDESTLPSNTLASYKVAAHQPRAVYIPKLKVAARLISMGVNKDNSLQSPRNIFDAGWYNKSAVPGKGGAVVIDGHASGPTREGLFAYLDTLSVGDKVTIETGDGTKYTYKVSGKEALDRSMVDMQKLMLPSGTALQGANFITCSGKWQENDATYSERTIVYTELVE